MLGLIQKMNFSKANEYNQLGLVELWEKRKKRILHIALEKNLTEVSKNNNDSQENI